MISSDPILDALARFPPVRGHLDAATSGVPPTSSVTAVREAVDAWAEGRIDGPAFDLDVQRSREAFARIVGVHPDDIACGGSASVFAGLVAAAVPAGGEVVFATGDFTSVVFPMLAQEPRGIRVREVPLERIPEAIDARTSLVAVSAVQSADGRLIDLDALARAADHHGADVYLDVTQAAGWLPIDASRFTFVCAGAYKWLLSPRGTALMAVAPRGRRAGRPPHRRLVRRRATRGPPSTAARYACPGPPSASTSRRPGLCWAGTAPSLELIDELGPAAIGAYDLALAAHLRRGLGHAAVRQRDRDRRPSGRRGAPAAGRRQGVGPRGSRPPQLPPAGHRPRHRPRADGPDLSDGANSR